MSEVVIVGGGVGGASAAALLASAGRPTLVLERESDAHDKVCGEFLSTEAQTYLRATGLELERLGAAPIRKVRVAAGTRLAESELPFLAFGLSRRRLDQALLHRAEELGAEVRRGVTVRSLSGGRELTTSAGVLRPKSLILASGKHDVRGAGRDSPERDRDMIGFKAHFGLSKPMRAALEGAVEIVLFEGGYAGLQLVEEGRANLCLLIRRRAFATLGQGWSSLFDRLMDEPHLRMRLADALQLTPKPLAVAAIPFGYIRRRPIAPTVYPIGDQAGVIASFTGDGMAIALHTAQLAVRAIAEGAPASAYHARLTSDLTRPVRLAHWLQRRSEAWPGRRTAVFALGLFPALLTRLAAWTRIPKSALAGI